MKKYPDNFNSGLCLFTTRDPLIVELAIKFVIRVDTLGAFEYIPFVLLEDIARFQLLLLERQKFEAIIQDRSSIAP